MATILVIDDDKRIRLMIRRILTSAGHLVIEAEDGLKGLARFAADNPDLVISDIVMPDQEGISTIRQLRQACGKLPILAISGGGSSLAGAEYLRMATDLGATAALGKPFGAEELIATVAALLAPGASVQ